jgi:hypothetical protein
VALKVRRNVPLLFGPVNQRSLVGPTAWAIHVGPLSPRLSCNHGEPFTEQLESRQRRVALFRKMLGLPPPCPSSYSIKGQHEWDRAGPSRHVTASNVASPPESFVTLIRMTL